MRAASTSSRDLTSPKSTPQSTAASRRFGVTTLGEGEEAVTVRVDASFFHKDVAARGRRAPGRRRGGGAVPRGRARRPVRPVTRLGEHAGLDRARRRSRRDTTRTWASTMSGSTFTTASTPTRVLRRDRGDRGGGVHAKGVEAYECQPGYPRHRPSPSRRSISAVRGCTRCNPSEGRPRSVRWGRGRALSSRIALLRLSTGRGHGRISLPGRARGIDCSRRSSSIATVALRRVDPSVEGSIYDLLAATQRYAATQYGGLLTARKRP